MENLYRAKIEIEKEIREAIVFLRKNNHTIPSETIELMKIASLSALKKGMPSINCEMDEF